MRIEKSKTKEHVRDAVTKINAHREARADEEASQNSEVQANTGNLKAGVQEETVTQITGCSERTLQGNRRGLKRLIRKRKTQC